MMESEEGLTTSTTTAIPSSHSPPRDSPLALASYGAPSTPMEPKVESQGEPQYDEELLLKWDDHHKSFFELAEDLCHQVRLKSKQTDNEKNI